MNVLPEDEIYFFEKTDGRFGKMYKKNGELRIVVPGNRFFSFGTIFFFALMMFCAYWWGWPVITYFTEVIFEPAVPLWFKILLFPVYFILLCIGLFIFVGVFFEFYSRKEFIFRENELICKKTLFYLFRFGKRFALNDVSGAVDYSQLGKSENNGYNLAIIAKNENYDVCGLHGLKYVESKKELIHFINSFLVEKKFYSKG